MVGDGSAATEGRIKQKVTLQSAPALLLLQNVDRLGRNREGKADRRVMDFLGSVIGDLSRGGQSPVFEVRSSIHNSIIFFGSTPLQTQDRVASAS